MEINLLALVGIAVATMFFGYFFGLFEGRGQGYKKRKQEEAIERRDVPAVPTTPGPLPKHDDRQSFLELGLGGADRPQLRIDGRDVDPLQVSTAERRRLIDLMVMLKPWIEPGGPVASTPATLASRRTPMPERMPFAAIRSGPPAAEPEVQSPTPPTPPAVGAQASLVTQIDAILQGRLSGTPLAGRSIRLAESLHGGAIVFVGSTQYDGVDKVTDPEIQSAIRAAIAEWENKYTPS